MRVSEPRLPGTSMEVHGTQLWQDVSAAVCSSSFVSTCSQSGMAIRGDQERTRCYPSSEACEACQAGEGHRIP